MFRNSLRTSLTKSFYTTIKRESRKGPSSTTTGTSRRASSSSFYAMDLFSFSPMYEYTSYSSNFGAFCSLISVSTLILFIAVSTKDFIYEPPELVKQGSMTLPVEQNRTFFEPPPVALSISYWLKDHTSGNWTNPKVDFTNSDPYFRYKFTAKAIREQDSLPRVETDISGVECSWDDATVNIVCPDEDLRRKQTIQGSYNLFLYQYFEVEVLKCSADSGATGCAPKEEIDALIEAGDVMVILHLREEIFDPIKYHYNNPKDTKKDAMDDYFDTKRGVYGNLQSWRFYALPRQEQLMEVYMEGRYVKIEERFIGSPPMKETTTKLISFRDLDTIYKYAPHDEITIMNFYFRMYSQTTSEEVQYWMRSLLDLFSYWGAMASFLSVCSFGVLARWYNQWKFQSNFQKEIGTTMKNDSKLVPTSNYQASSTGHIFDDIRLFNQSDFDNAGQLKMTREEFYFPSTPYGEVRKIALMEHLRKRNAANKIGSWYKRKTEILQKRNIKILRKGRESIEDDKNQEHVSFPLSPTTASWQSSIDGDLLSWPSFSSLATEIVVV
mmetsp:Transcript_18248/g.27364  ORF Transcript_18248/g.27364 Transcript_18248/m.27364 type:complete len:553 (-) Transcript_18248:118-1776(-)|eukprot:CAMPEP_0203666188 /NCGR_PEP_ID=MMETSP0090-20130426/3252_1 /ASSEMBLY_ACC=CAM_ASM_001088 /TAXON_ID=426623 /ORGANISM="Chaetoceros affinis, Strain CCMP159" /LENGTH=552 /DNA_ID=CAMNT_0050529985 /DNA_START=392 /DNA_END=2050 /DNA_ORIENTATION=-